MSKEIVRLLKKVDMPDIVNKISITLSGICKNTDMEKLSDLFSNDGQKTQSTSQFIGHLFEHFLKQQLLKMDGFTDKVSMGHDCVFEGHRVEIKSTQQNDSFTGSSHSVPVSYTIMLSYTLNDVGHISDVFFAFVDLSKCYDTKWSHGTSLKSGYSKLQIGVMDDHRNNIDVILGGLSPKRRWCHFIKESIC